MPIWRLEPGEENRVTELQSWIKGSEKLTRKELFAHSSFLSDSPEKPNIDLDNPNGFEVTSNVANWSMEGLDSRPNGPWITWVFPASMTNEEKNRISGLIDIEMYSALEQDGWIFEKTEYWFYGPLVLTEVRQ